MALGKEGAHKRINLADPSAGGCPRPALREVRKDGPPACSTSPRQTTEHTRSGKGGPCVFTSCSDLRGHFQLCPHHCLLGNALPALALGAGLQRPGQRPGQAVPLSRKVSSRAPCASHFTFTSHGESFSMSHFGMQLICRPQT